MHKFTSKHLQRVINIVQHLRADEKRQPKFFNAVLAFQNSGNLHGMTISDAWKRMDEFSESEDMQQSLLNTSNDVTLLVQTLIRLANCDKFAFEIIGRVTRGTLHRRLEYFTSCNNCVTEGVILYWSGHGRIRRKQEQNELYLTMEEDCMREASVPLSEICSLVQGPMLLILECCHSGAAVKPYGSFRYDQSPTFVLASCSENEVSGSWVMDGEDTGAIMTGFLTNPVCTYFKAQFHVFYDFGGHWLSKDENNAKDLYTIFDKYLDRIIDEWVKHASSSTHLRSSVLALKWIRAHAKHIFVLFKNYLLFIKYSSILHLPQTAHSFPDLSSTRSSSIWQEFEQSVEEKILELWEIRANTKSAAV